MRRVALLGLVFLLAACGKGAPPPPPPANAIQPEGINYPAIKENKLFGAGCNFVAEGGGLSALVLAQEKEAIFKLDGKIVRVPADKGSQLLSDFARTRYIGPVYIVILAPIPGRQSAENGQIQSLDASLMITNTAGKVQFAAKGQVQCKPM